MFKNILLSLFCCSFILTLFAEDAQQQNDVQDLKYIYQIEYTANKLLYRIGLPDDAYLEDLNTVRVFNAENIIMPFALYSEEQQQIVQKTNMQIFPLKDFCNQQQQLVNELCTDYSKDRQNFFLAQASSLKQEVLIKELDFGFQDTSAHWLIDISVFDFKNSDRLLGTTKLEKYNSSNNKQTIASINIPDTKLTQANIFLIKLDLTYGEQLPQLKTAVATTTKKLIPITIERNAKLVHSSNSEAIYTIEKDFNLQNFIILPQQKNIVIPVEVYYAVVDSANKHKLIIDDTKKPVENWRKIWTIDKIYDFNKQEENSFSVLTTNNVRQIKIVALKNEWGKDPPLVVSKVPRKGLIFNPQQEQKLYLGFGSKRQDQINSQVNSQALDLDFFISGQKDQFATINKLPIAQINKKQNIFTESAVTAKTQDKRLGVFLFYAILGLIICIMLFFVFKLQRENQK